MTRKWEYIDLTTLLPNNPVRESPTAITVSGQTIIVNPPDHHARKPSHNVCTFLDRASNQRIRLQFTCTYVHTYKL